MDAPSTDPAARLIQRLKEEGRPFEALAPLGGPLARVRFVGPFEGRDVAWDATLIALRAPEAAAQRPAGGPNFIEVGAPGPRGLALTVGLGLAAIDEPAILKAIVMIRRYKRLRPGYHAYGTPRSPHGHPG